MMIEDNDARKSLFYGAEVCDTQSQKSARLRISSVENVMCRWLWWHNRATTWRTSARPSVEDAWRRLENSKAPWASEDYSTAARTILARHIIEMAQGGERDPKWLADSALLYIAATKTNPQTARRHLTSKIKCRDSGTFYFGSRLWHPR